MSFSDETLMAYADGELGQPEREQVERAMRDDAALAARVAQHQALRAGVFAAFAPVLDEPMPARLTAAALPDKVADLAAARAGARQPADEADDVAGGAAVANTAATQARAPRRASSWAQWGGMAASLVVGVLAGSVLLGGGREPSGVAGSGDALVATGALAEALSSQLAGGMQGGAGGAGVKIGVSFAAKDGTLCRSFIAGTAAGLACRSGGQWTLPVVAQAEQAAAGDYRQAASAMPAPVLEAIDARIAGPALDAEGERAARQAGWVGRRK